MGHCPSIPQNRGLVTRIALKMANYQVKIQAIRSRGHNERPFVTIPVAIARALDLQKGETVEWKIVDRSQLLLLRQPQPSPIKPPAKPKDG